MNLTQIESKLKVLVKSIDPNTFIYDLLGAYNLPKASITRLQKGNLNLSKNDGEIIWKKKLYFRFEDVHDLHHTITDIEKNHKHNERFLIVTDYITILSIDTRTGDRLDCEIKDLPKHYDFFLPWAGMEKTRHANENPADVKAAEKMAKLFDAIKQNNPDDSPEFIHGLNIFLSRLLFCYFAEDTNIFSENQFTNAISSHTQTDGSDLDEYLFQLFKTLDTPKDKRGDIPKYLNDFPYVNGGLFKDKLDVPKLDRKVRQSMIDGGELNWSDINPDIFGSMFQAVIDVDQRGSLGQHYTSVPNIMKVIEPLFLNDLKEEFERSKGNKKKLTDLLQRLSNIKIFDPACGSGNFLIIAYKELRRLEIQILHQLQGIHETVGMGSLDFGSDYLSHISLNNFYGIEIDDFAHEIAKLALWLAEHQMNQEFFKTIGKSNPTLPLKDAGQIVCGNACRLDWEKVCPKSKDDEVYVLGNPPYLGSKDQSKNQKDDMDYVFDGFNGYKKLDYISCWMKLGADYIRHGKFEYAFVSTNSICQGEQVQLLWPYIINNDGIISFAYQPFHWTNNAKDKAGVTCIIVGVGNSQTYSKPLRIYSKGVVNCVKSISPYLTSGNSVIVAPRKYSISGLPQMIRGSQPTDGGNLVLSKSEKLHLLDKYPDASAFIKRYVGADDFLNDKERWCIWLTEDDLEKALRIKEIADRIELVRQFRLSSKKAATVKKSSTPYFFDEVKHQNSVSLLLPIISSHRRNYLPIGYLGDESVISNKGQVIYNAPSYLLSLLSSKMHMVWMKLTSSKMRMDYQYSNTLSYNTFPFPKISKQKQEELTQCTFRIIEARERYSDRTLAQLYDPDKMPADLLEAHRLNDEAVERCYISTPFGSDEERLEYLFKLYEKMIEEEKKS